MQLMLFFDWPLILTLVHDYKRWIIRVVISVMDRRRKRRWLTFSSKCLILFILQLILAVIIIQYIFSDIIQNIIVLVPWHRLCLKTGSAYLMITEVYWLITSVRQIRRRTFLEIWIWFVDLTTTHDFCQGFIDLFFNSNNTLMLLLFHQLRLHFLFLKVFFQSSDFVGKHSNLLVCLFKLEFMGLLEFIFSKHGIFSFEFIHFPL